MVLDNTSDSLFFGSVMNDELKQKILNYAGKAYAASSHDLNHKTAVEIAQVKEDLTITLCYETEALEPLAKSTVVGLRCSRPIVEPAGVWTNAWWIPGDALP